MAVDPATLTDPAQLRMLAKNAAERGHPDLALQCQVRIAELAGQAYDDILEREFWAALTAQEEVATQQKGKAFRLTHIRQKVARVGVVQYLTHWALEPNTAEAFDILVSGGRADMTGEAVVLRHPNRFPPEVVTSARAKLPDYPAAAPEPR